MEDPQSYLPPSDGLYKDHVGADIYPFVAISRPPSLSQAFKYTLEGIRTDRPGRPYSVISRATIQDQGQARQVVVKTYRKIGDISAVKVAQV